MFQRNHCLRSFYLIFLKISRSVARVSSMLNSFARATYRYSATENALPHPSMRAENFSITMQLAKTISQYADEYSPKCNSVTSQIARYRGINMRHCILSAILNKGMSYSAQNNRACNKTTPVPPQRAVSHHKHRKMKQKATCRQEKHAHNA